MNALHRNVARQILTVMRTMRERVWAAANVKLEAVTLDTDTTVHTLYGQQMGGRKSYNPKNKGKKSYQPMLTFIAETREYVWGELRNGDRPTGKQIGDHMRNACAAAAAGREANSTAARIRASTAGKRWKPMKNADAGSSIWRARRPGWSRNCGRRSGSRRRRRTPMRSANSVISRRDGARHTGSWPCAMRKRARKWRRRRPSSTSCSKPAGTRTGSS